MRIQSRYRISCLFEFLLGLFPSKTGPYICIFGVCGLFLTSKDVSAKPTHNQICDSLKTLNKAHATYSDSEPQFLHIQSRLTFIRRGGATTTKRFSEFYQFPDRARFEYQDANTSSVVATDGVHSWRATKQGPAMQRSEHFTVPIRMRNFGSLIRESISANAESECVQELDNSLQRILVTLGKREMILLDIDPVTGLIHRYQGESPDTGKSDMIQIEILEWKKIQDTWVAAKFNTSVNHIIVTRNEFVAAEFPSTIPSAVFRPQL
jgi:hypothetical protein